MTSYITSEVRRVGSATGFLLKDGLGSVRYESQTGGTSAWRDYGPYGMPSNDNGLTAANGRGYINERFDPETGLQYLHARYATPSGLIRPHTSRAEFRRVGSATVFLAEGRPRFCASSKARLAAPRPGATMAERSALGRCAIVDGDHDEA